ncbi:hypothetical protein DPMN_180233 [Dreissena polymorpha]|uniref:Uncharacterized protein n=1 Tax=Dreissena polymorpha TaxID=45954 RepID=A0A9D4IN29_DREPO|nr:hypothetical protein DPMN_180233 [Dreissena polymorpha]
MKSAKACLGDIIGTNLLTKFHKDRKINVAFRENAPPPGSHVFQPTGIIFELVQDIIGMDLLTKFHEDRTVNVASRVLTRFYYSHIRKYAPPPLGSHLFLKLIQNIIKTNLLIKFHEDWTINVASRVLTRFYYGHIHVKLYKENCPTPGGHVFKATKTIFKLIQDIIGTNLLTNQKINVTSRVLTRKIAPPTWWPYIIGMNLLTKFHEDRTINVASRMLTRFYYSHIYSHIRKNAPSLGSHVFQAKFHKDRKINVASRVLTRKNAPGSHVFQPTGIIFELVQDIFGMNLLTKKNAPPLGSHVFQANVTIFELIEDIIETNLLTKFHNDWTIKANVDAAQRTTHGGQKTITKAHHEHVVLSQREYQFAFDLQSKCLYKALTRKNAPSPGSHVFQPTDIIFELFQEIIGMNLLTKFHEHRTINVASRVKNGPPLGSHVFQANVTIFELIQDIIETNLLTKFHEDWTINVASRE